MPIFNTLKALDNYIVNVTNKEIAEHSSRLAVNLMNEVIIETIYKNPSHMKGGIYENTYGMLDKATATINRYGSGIDNTGTSVDITINPDGEYPNMYGDVRNNNDMIVSWLNHRAKGGYYNSRPIKPQNYDMFGKLNIKLTSDRRLKTYIQNFLRAKGYVISKRSFKNE
jgi:hypothetical protein